MGRGKRQVLCLIMVKRRLSVIGLQEVQEVFDSSSIYLVGCSVREQKEKLLNLINSDDFYFQKSEELEGIYQKLTSPWGFLEQLKSLTKE